jgi:hypothetical protein
MSRKTYRVYIPMACVATLKVQAESAEEAFARAYYRCESEEDGCEDVGGSSYEDIPPEEAAWLVADDATLDERVVFRREPEPLPPSGRDESEHGTGNPPGPFREQGQHGMEADRRANRRRAR